MLKKLIYDKSGQAMVEMALVAPILVMFLMGIIEFGRLYNSYLILDNATRAATRIAATGASDSDIQNKITSLISTLPNKSNIVVNISPLASNRVRGQDIQVQSKYPFKFITPVIGNILGNPLTLTSTVTMRLE